MVAEPEVEASVESWSMLTALLELLRSKRRSIRGQLLV